jgi:tRNA (cytidine/uridine-2'-O-)-methyltransferase
MTDITQIDHIKIENPVLNVVLYQPEIPANTGNIARLCGAAMVRLHLVHPLGFMLDNRHLKRAGLDYWHEVDIVQHMSFEEFIDIEKNASSRMHAFSRFAQPEYTKADVRHGDYLLFGQETLGLPSGIKEKYPCYRIPVMGRVRSLNLSTTVGIVVYHYLHSMGRF